MSTKRLLSACLALVLVVANGAAAALDPALPDYQKRAGVAGTLSSAGSDTLANLMTLWAEAFQRQYPGVSVQVQAAGSSTAPPALVQGTASLGPMSRRMKHSELQAFESRYGYPPTAVPVAIDALALFVNKDNPVRRLTLAQVDAIFSSTRLCGAPRDALRWRDLGVDGALAAQPIQLFGRNAVSGTYGYFKEAALCGGDYKANVNELPGSASVVQAIASSRNAVGYSGIGYRTSSVRAVPLVDRDGQLQTATEANALAGRYPLTRYLFLYLNKAPGAALPPLEAEFVRLVLSRQGQEAVRRDGYVPLPANVAARALRELGL